MVKSMTGYGRGEYIDEKKSITVEIKAVNHRYCDVYVKMPRRYSFAEERIKSDVRDALKRGKIEVLVTVDSFGESENDIRLNEDVARKYYRALKALEETFELDQRGGVTLSMLAGMPDVIKAVPAEEDEEAMLHSLGVATEIALQNIINMRAAEGERLAKDILNPAQLGIHHPIVRFLIPHHTVQPVEGFQQGSLPGTDEGQTAVLGVQLQNGQRMLGKNGICHVAGRFRLRQGITANFRFGVPCGNGGKNTPDELHIPFFYVPAKGLIRKKQLPLSPFFAAVPAAGVVAFQIGNEPVVGRQLRQSGKNFLELTGIYRNTGHGISSRKKKPPVFQSRKPTAVTE